MLEYITMKKFCEQTGYTEKACRGKISRGDWLENRVFIKAPDGRILINLEGFNRWVESGMVTERRKEASSKSSSPTWSGAVRGSGSSPLPLV